MADNCKTCGGRGFVFGIAVPGGILACTSCNRFQCRAEARGHICLCCEAHDELVAACMEARGFVEGALAVVDWAPNAEFLDRLEAALAKAQPSQEAGK